MNSAQTNTQQCLKIMEEKVLPLKLAQLRIRILRGKSQVRTPARSTLRVLKIITEKKLLLCSYFWLDFNLSWQWPQI